MFPMKNRVVARVLALSYKKHARHEVLIPLNGGNWMEERERERKRKAGRAYGREKDWGAGRGIEGKSEVRVEMEVMMMKKKKVFRSDSSMAQVSLAPRDSTKKYNSKFLCIFFQCFFYERAMLIIQTPLTSMLQLPSAHGSNCN